MPEREEDKHGQWRQRIYDAIKLATEGNWKKAVEANESIIKVFPTDVDAYNRLGRAYMELGEYKKAMDAYSKALKLSPYNTIAKKNLERLSLLKDTKVVAEKRQKAKPSDFIEDLGGKSGRVNLQEIAPQTVLARLSPGEWVYLEVRNQDTIVKDESGNYLGIIEPEHGLRLAKLLKGGNKYIAAILSLDNVKVKVIISEKFQHPSQSGKLSFPIKVAEESHIKDSLLRHSTGEDEGTGLDEAETGDGEDVETVPEGFSIYEGYASPGDLRMNNNFGDEE